MRYIYFILIVILSSHNIFSQQKFSISIKTGYINSWNATPGIVYGTTLDKGHQNSLSAGISGNYAFAKHLSVEANLLFSQKGYKLNSFFLYDNFGNPVQQSQQQAYSLSYLDLPIYIKYSFGKKLQPFIGIGGMLSYNISHNYGKPYILHSWDSIYVAPSNKPQSLYGSFVCTAGITYKRLSVQALFVLGVTNAIKSGNLNMSEGYISSYQGSYYSSSVYTHTASYPSTTVKATHLNSISLLLAYKINNR